MNQNHPKAMEKSGPNMHHQSISMHPWYIEATSEGGGESTTILSVTTEDDERPVINQQQ